MKEKNIFQTINYLNAKTDTKKIHILLDIIKCYFKYNITQKEYRILKLYELNNEQRKTILSNNFNKKLIKNFNKPEDNSIYKYRRLFNKKYNRFLENNWLELTGNNITEFRDFIDNKKEIIAFSDLISNKESKLVDIDLKNYTNTYNELVLSKKNIISDILTESEETKKLNDNKTNILSFIMLNDNIMYTYMKSYDEKNNELYISINSETGIIDYPAVDINMNTYEIHPVTGNSIVWMKLPRWPRTKRFAEKIAKFIPDAKYIQIDMMFTINGPTLLNIKIDPDYIPIQLINIKYNSMGTKLDLLDCIEGEIK